MNYDLNGFRTVSYSIGDRCWIAVRERALKADESDAACAVTEFTRQLNRFLEKGVRHFELDLSQLREIDESGFGLLRRLQERAGLTLLLPERELMVEPLALGILLYTRFNCRFIHEVA
jgi:hypothetical protein